MYSSNVTQLVEIFSNADIFLLVFIRVFGFVSIVPIIGGRNVPSVTKIGFSLAVAGIVYLSGITETVVYDDNVAGYVLLIIKEYLVGLMIGFIVFSIFNVFFLAGFYIDQQMGLSMSNILDPLSQTQVPISGNLYYFIMSFIFILTGGHYKIIQTFVSSYRLVGIGAAKLVGNADIFNVFLQMITYFFIMGMKIAMPVVGMLLILDIALGLLVKTAPQINVFVVGVPIKLLAGLVIVFFVAPMLLFVYETLMDNIVRYVFDIIKVMVP